MVALLRFRKVTRTVRVELPNGATRKVKVTTNDARDIQQVEDNDVLHGTARPAPIAFTVSRPAPSGAVLRNVGMPKGRQEYSPHGDTGLWAPVPGTLTVVERRDKERR